jgi:integrating conjugative element relaxase (TIGR03760 family)
LKSTFIRLFKKEPTTIASINRPTTTLETETGADGFITPKTANELLSEERREVILDRIWEQTSVSRESFTRLYQAPIARYAELVQELPASESHHHSYLGGMLDHGLELVLYALRLRQSYLLPVGAAPEDQAAHADVWTAGVAYGGLMHDTGKLLCDIRVETKSGQPWHPWHGPLTEAYRFKYIPGRDYKLHNAAAAVMVHQVLGTEVMDWISKNQPLWGSLLYLLSGDYTEAGVLGEIVSKADRTSTAMNIGANPEKALQAPPTTLQSHLIRGLRQLLKDDEHKLKMNMPGAACWLTADGLWLVSKVVADKLRAFLLSQSVDKVPSKNSSLFDELQSHRLIEPNADGNAIWKAKVIDGTWEQEFTFLRVKPSLIYGNEEYPPTFTGTITWDDKPVSPSESTVINDEAKKPASPPVQPTKNQAPQMSSPTATESPAVDDGIDDILSLLGMNTPEDLTTPTPDTEKAVNSEQEETGPIIKPSTEPVKAVTQPTKPAVPEKPSKPAAIVQASPKPKQAPTKIPGSQLTPENLGQSFIDWIKAAVSSRSIYINDSRAQIHTVDGKAFLVTPGIFQRFSDQHPELQQLNPDTTVKNWIWVQRSFERLQLHIKREDDLNIWQCTVRGPRVKGNTLNGYLIPTDVIFTFQPQDNPFVALKSEFNN